MKISRRKLLLSSTAVMVGTSSFAAQASASLGVRVPWRLPEKRPFKIIENEWIPLRDGTLLAARLWLPDGAETTPVPVVFEYLPYRKRDMTRPRDDHWANAFVPYGFAFVRVDIRGSGESDGILTDEYLLQEQADAVEVIAWLAGQRWSTGAVGMRGKSWGGFNSLQVAAKAPPALKAIVTHCATDNRYTDDAHYVGGALMFDKLNWGAEFKTVMVEPPDPAIVGERWHEMWVTRLNAASPVFSEWLRHQRYDAFWQHGSVATDYSQIKCPVYAVGGQTDAYRNFIPQLLANLKVPRKGLMGPWGHRFPQDADPGPGLDWAAEETRWWTQWLTGVDTGIMKEPVLEAFMEYQTPAETWPKDTPGRWVAEKAWPSTQIKSQTYYLNANGLALSQQPDQIRSVRSQETLGLTKPDWFPDIFSIDLAADQTPDDKRSLTFDSVPLTGAIEILGRPIVKILVSSNKPVAKLTVRLNEVTPDGKSWSVSYGILNLTHRTSDTNPTALEPHRRYEVDVQCFFTAHRFKKGSMIRLAVSESLWPMVWPSPEPVTLQITTGASHLLLPIRAIEPTPYAMPIDVVTGRVEQEAKSVKLPTDSFTVTQVGPDAEGRVELRKAIHSPSLALDTGSTVTVSADWHRSITEGDPNSSVWKMAWSARINRGSWDTTISSSIEMTSTATEFHVKESVHALEGDKAVLDRQWQNTIKRDLM
jgi:putative CocE/NonD family hydrolase